MKRLLFLLLCAGLCAALHAQFRVYSFNGQIKYKSRTADTYGPWTSVRNDLSLTTLDSLWIPEGASIRIEDVRPHVIYNSSQTGRMYVYDIVRQAKKGNAMRITKAMNVEIASGKKTTMNEHMMSVIGSGSRACILNNDTIEMLAEMFAWIGAQACTKAKSPTVAGIVFKRYRVGDDWDFEFQNRTDKDYHINIVHVNKRTNTASLCYVVTDEIAAEKCPLTPSGFSTCALEVFFPNSEQDVYVLVATEFSYDTEALDNELIYHPVDKARPANLDVKYTWL